MVSVVDDVCCVLRVVCRALCGLVCDGYIVEWGVSWEVYAMLRVQYGVCMIWVCCAM